MLPGAGHPPSPWAMKTHRLALAALFAILPVTAHAEGLGAEANYGRADGHWGTELGAGYALNMAGFSLTPGAGVYLRDATRNSMAGSRRPIPSPCPPRSAWAPASAAIIPAPMRHSPCPFCPRFAQRRMSARNIIPWALRSAIEATNGRRQRRSTEIVRTSGVPCTMDRPAGP